MAFIEWTDKNKVNIKEVDDQHKHLFAILNRLHDAVTEGKEQGELFSILDELIEYTVEHFQTEEQLYVKHAFPGYEEHKAEHDKLAGTAVDLQAKLRDGSATLSFELLDFLHDWLMDHTLGLDQEMGPYMNERGVF
ncbi:MAG: bacteriohemerythrin [Proteobacteria bacterium]|nr:bacteriohemerythrin [Pseudomonadota bacterium]